MIRLSLKTILIAFLVIFLMSRSRRIIDFFSELDTGGTLTLEPLRNSSESGRYVVTVTLFALAFVIIWKIYLKNK